MLPGGGLPAPPLHLLPPAVGWRGALEAVRHDASVAVSLYKVSNNGSLHIIIRLIKY